MKTYTCRPSNAKAVETLKSQGIPPLLALVLAGRGHTDLKSANSLIKPEKTPPIDPFLLPDMQIGVEVIQAALDHGKTIAVFGDYDVDGITATALLAEFLEDKGSKSKIMTYIPRRLSEGYGLSMRAIDHLKELGAHLIITVDCGISSLEEANYASELGIDIVITDHHTCQGELPKVKAVINPRREDSTYPFVPLAGVGVALKLALALTPREGWDEVTSRYCELVAIGTIADVMPMEGENRTLVREGLDKINKDPRLGVRLLMGESGYLVKEITAVGVGYSLAPRLNAAGRMDNPQLAVDLLLTNSPERAIALVGELCSLNTKRQEAEVEVYRQCLKRLEEKPPQALIFLSDDIWHQGVVGIVASRLTDKYRLPVFMICCENGIANGSGRNNLGINMFELLEKSADLLLSYGGHPQASGFTLKEERLEELYEKLKHEIEILPPNLEEPTIEVDAITDLSQITCRSISTLDALEPSGVGHPRPILLAQNVTVLRVSMVAEAKHLKMRVRQGRSEIDAIYFFYRDTIPTVGDVVHLAFYPQNNHFRGSVSAQLQLVAIFPVSAFDHLEELFDKWQAHRELTCEEADMLCPTREQLTKLYDYFRAGEVDTLPIPKTVTGGRIQALCNHVERVLEIPGVMVQVAFVIFSDLKMLDLLWEESGAQISFPLAPKETDFTHSHLLMQLHNWSSRAKEAY